MEVIHLFARIIQQELILPSVLLKFHIFNLQIEIFKIIKIKYGPFFMTFSFTKKQKTVKYTFEGH